ncbi:MAG: hypothetical protein ABH889_02720 [Candidatus Portnoybacteria bacterium]
MSTKWRAPQKYNHCTRVELPNGISVAVLLKSEGDEPLPSDVQIVACFKRVDIVPISTINGLEDLIRMLNEQDDLVEFKAYGDGVMGRMVTLSRDQHLKTIIEAMAKTLKLDTSA